MKNKINLPKGISTDDFKQAIDLHLKNNLTDYLRQVLANILALDYATRLKSEPDINEYASLCTSRLKTFLQRRVVTEESFAEAMSLFTIAISQEQEAKEESHLSTEKSQNAAIDSIIMINFSDLSDTEISSIKNILKDLLAEKNIDEIMNFINSQPNLFRDIVISAVEQKKKQQEIIDFITTHITKAINKLNAANARVTSLKNIISKVTVGIGLFATASIGLVIGGAILPVLIVPSAIAAIKYAPKISDNIGKVIENNVSVAKVNKEDIIEPKVVLQNKLQKKVRGTKTYEVVKAKKQVKDKEQLVAVIKSEMKNKSKAKTVSKTAVKVKKKISRSR